MQSCFPILLEVAVHYPTYFGGLYYVNGDGSAQPNGGRTLMLGDTRGVDGGHYAVGRTQNGQSVLHGPVLDDLVGRFTEVVRLLVKKTFC